MTIRKACALSIPLALCTLLATPVGCGGGGGGGRGGAGATGGSGATGGGACPTSSATGTLAIVIDGTPSGNGAVIVGPVATGSQVTTSSNLPVAAGPTTVTGFLTAEPGPLVRTAYTPVVDNTAPCVRAGQTTTVHVTYSLIDTSGLVWTGVTNGAVPATLLGYDPTTV